jgi:hypothetical protein
LSEKRGRTGQDRTGEGGRADRPGLTCADGALHLDLLPLLLIELSQTRLQDSYRSSFVHVLRSLVLTGHNQT